MKYRSPTKYAGFTLIETLIYAAIVSILLSFAIITAYQIISSDDRVIYRNELTENQKFVLQKIYWALQNISSIDTPALGASGDTLSINKLNYPFNPIIITTDNNVIELTSGATTTPLTNSYISTSTISFEHIDLTDDSALKISIYFENKFGSTTTDTVIFLD
jgi:Tfp pilus assembly protein PilE